jgi:DNA damage-inducible protein 1
VDLWCCHEKGCNACAAGDEAKVARLMALGFPRQLCLEVLAACGGNEEHAASLLFEMSGSGL